MAETTKNFFEDMARDVIAGRRDISEFKGLVRITVEATIEKMKSGKAA